MLLQMSFHIESGECEELNIQFHIQPQILLTNKEINPAELDFLLRYPVQPGASSPVDFLSNHSWGGVKVRKQEVPDAEEEREIVVADVWSWLMMNMGDV